MPDNPSERPRRPGTHRPQRPPQKPPEEIREQRDFAQDPDITTFGGGRPSSDAEIRPGGPINRSIDPAAAELREAASEVRQFSGQGETSETTPPPPPPPNKSENEKD